MNNAELKAKMELEGYTAKEFTGDDESKSEFVFENDDHFINVYHDRSLAIILNDNLTSTLERIKKRDEIRAWFNQLRSS